MGRPEEDRTPQLRENPPSCHSFCDSSNWNFTQVCDFNACVGNVSDFHASDAFTRSLSSGACTYGRSECFDAFGTGNNYKMNIKKAELLGGINDRMHTILTMFTKASVNDEHEDGLDLSNVLSKDQ